MQLEEFLERLDGVRPMGQCPQKFAAKCPSHPDRVGSLVITDGMDKILARCHAGCSFGQIVECMGLVEGDLFYGGRVERAGGPVSLADVQPARTPSATTAAPSTSPGGRPAGGMSLDGPILEAWKASLTDDLAARLTELKGWSMKTVRDLGLCFIPGPRPEAGRVGLVNYDGDGRAFGYVRYQPNKAMLGDERPKVLAVGPRELYPSPELLPAGDVWLVEGEADRVSAHEIGLNACAVPGVATWKQGWAERFAGRRVVVCFDCDMPGRSAAANRVLALRALGVDVVGVDLFPGRQDGYDVGDALAAAHVEGRVDDLRRYLVRLEMEAWDQRAAA